MSRGKAYGQTQPPVGRPINRSASIAQGIVLACPINEPGGLRAFDYAQGISGTNTSTPARTARGYATTGSSRVNFAAGTIKNVAQTNVSPFSISMWIRNSGFANSGNLWGWGNSGAGTYCNINAIGSGLLNFDYFDGTRYIRAQTSSPLTQGATARWTHIVFTRDNTNAIFPATETQKIYINGVDSGTIANAGVGTPNTVSLSALPFSIGGRGSAGAVFTGSINNFMIWSRTLSLSEVRNLYANPYSIYK